MGIKKYFSGNVVLLSVVATPGGRLPRYPSRGVPLARPSDYLEDDTWSIKG